MLWSAHFCRSKHEQVDVPSFLLIINCGSLWMSNSSDNYLKMLKGNLWLCDEGVSISR
jgi:hypothetical protein